MYGALGPHLRIPGEKQYNARMHAHTHAHMHAHPHTYTDH